MGATPEQFVRAWQTSNSPREVAEKLGMTPSSVSARATFYRVAKVVPLKLFRRGKKGTDWQALAQLAKELHAE